MGTASISGSVVLQGSASPMRGAHVSLTGTELRGGRTVVTDNAGQFTFQALPAGRFTMTASKPGYVDMAYGAKQPGRQGTPIEVADGQKIEKLVIAIPRGSVITGVVVDENGDPTPGIQVRALRFVLRTGEKTLQQAGTNQTDDRGIYRIYQLQPGDYVVSAIPRNTNLNDIRQSITAEIQTLMQQSAGRGGNSGTGAALGAILNGAQSPQVTDRISLLQQQLTQLEPDQNVAYAPVYYPGTTSPSQAATVTIGTAEERGGVDFRLQQVPTSRVEGVVVSTDGSVLQGTQVALVALDRAAGSAVPGVGTNMSRTGADGRFVFTNVTPGQYSVQARATIRRTDASGPQAATGRGGGRGPGGFGPPGAAGAIAQVLWASTDIAVTGQKLPDTLLNLQPGMTISGRVDFQGSQQPPGDLTRVRVTLSTRGQQMFDIGGTPPADVDASGRFTIAGVAPGRYVLGGSAPSSTATVTAAAPAAAGRGGVPGRAGAAATTTVTTGGGWILKSAIVGGRDVLDFPIDIQPNQDVSGVVLTFTDRTQGLSGTIQDASGHATSDFTILLFPTDDRYWLPQARRISSTRPGTDGRFSFPSMPAGEYRLAAVTDMEPGELYDPSFLTQVVPASTPVSLAEGERKVQDIKLAGGG